MKKNFLKLGAGIAMMLLVTACSNNARMSNLLDKIPAKADLVMVGDLKTVVESAGGTVEGSKIELPSFITSELKGNAENEIEKCLDEVKESGVDASACALVINSDDREPTLVFSIDDEEAFVKYIEEKEYENDKEEDGVTYYTRDNSGSSSCMSCIAVTDGVAYYLGETYSDETPMKHVRKIIRNADEESFGSTSYADYLTEGNAFGLAFKLPKELKRQMKEAGIPKDLANFYTGVLCVKGNLGDTDAEFGFKMFDEEGNEKDIKALEKYMKLDGTINPTALEYLGDKEVMVYALSMKEVNWDKYLNAMLSNADIDRASLAVVKSYLEKFDGTVAFGIGLNNGITSAAKVNYQQDVMQEIPMTLVAETKDGKAKTILSDIKSLLDKDGLTYNNTADGLSLDLPTGVGVVYLAAKDNFLIISSHEIKKGNNNPAVKLGGYDAVNSMFAVVLNKDNQLAKDLGLKNNIQAVASFDAKAMEGTLKLTIDDNSEVGIIGKLAKAIITISNNVDKIQTKVNAARPSYDSYYDPYEQDYDYADPVG